MSTSAHDARTARATEPILAALMRLLPPAVPAVVGRRPFLLLCIRTGALLGTFVLIEHVVMGVSRLPAAAYGQPFLVVELLARLGSIAAAVAVLAALVLTRHGRLLARWSDLDLGGQLRPFVVFLAFLVAWPLTTYEFNYYFDQGHYLDRALLAALVPLVYLRPVFVYPFLALVFAVMWQIGEPALGGTIFAHKLQVLHVLDLFAAAWLLHALTGSRRCEEFLFLTCCIVAAAYWEPALAKIEIGWVTHGQLYHMPLAAYAHGWLAFLEPVAVVAFARHVAWFDWPMRIFVLVAEAGCLLFLWRRSVSIALLAAVMTFHVGVFALYGFLFWTWFLLDAALLVLLVRDRRAQRIRIYGRGHLALSVPLIGLGGLWVDPPPLGWFDTGLTYTYRVQAVGANGERHALPPRYFGAYEDVFTMASFAYLVPGHGVLTGPYGITKSRSRAEAIARASTSAGVFALESEVGPRQHDPDRAARFYAFVTRYVTNRNARGERPVAWLRALRAPAQFWSFDRGDVHPPGVPVREVVVEEVTTQFDGERLRPIRIVELARIPITPDATPAESHR